MTVFFILKSHKMLYFHSAPPVVFIYISQNVALRYSVPCLSPDSCC